MNHNRSFYGKKVCVIIPCMDRVDMLNTTLPRWLEQIYSLTQICIVDYSSSKNVYSQISRYANRYHVTLDYNVKNSEAKISLLRLENLDRFNMSHAINYGIRMTKSDVISVAGTECIPSPFYLECALAAIDHNVFTRCIRGRLTFPRQMIEMINGYPESMQYWGGEDDIVIWQFRQLGHHIIDLSYLLCHNIHHYDYYHSNNFHSKFNPTNNRKIDETIAGIDPQKMGSYLNLVGFNHSESKKCNNNGNEYGQSRPILLPKQDIQKDSKEILTEWNELHKKYYTPMQKSYYGQRVAVLIPCKNRLNNLLESLPQWLDQLYTNKQIVIVDYDSDVPIIDAIREIANTNKTSITYNEYDYSADIVVFRLENKKYFNISHAYNYAARRIKTDVLCTVCADSCAVDYYLDIVMNLVSDFNIIQCYWGLHTITYPNWKKLNGHQEIVVGWGGEDVDFQLRAKIMGLYPVIIPKHLVFHIPQDTEIKGHHRMVSNPSRSFLINDNRLSQYIATYGHIGNFGYSIGKEEPVKDESSGLLRGDLSRLYIAIIEDKDKDSLILPDYVNYNEETKTHYVISKEFFDWTVFIDPEKIKLTMTYLVYDSDDIEKQLYIASKSSNGSHYLDSKAS